jgi:hypothetical protein
MKITTRLQTALVVALALSFFFQVVEASSEWHIESPQTAHDINVDDASNHTADTDAPENHCCQLHCHHVFVQDVATSTSYIKNSQLPAMADTAYRYVRLTSLLRPPAVI